MLHTRRIPWYDPSRRWWVVLLIAGTALATPAAAQYNDVGALQPGDSVRLRLPGALRLNAQMSALRADTLMLVVEGLNDLWPVSSFDLVTLERFAQRDSRQGFRHGALMGMAAGVFVGAGIGLGLHASGVGRDTGEVTIDGMNTVLRWTGLGFALGAIGGGFLGGAKPGRGWVPVALPSR